MKLRDDLKRTDQLLQLTKDFSSRFLSAIDKLAVANFNFINYVPENSRRQRALPAWFSLLAQNKHFKLLAPVRLCVVCLTLDVPEAQQEMAVNEFLQELNS